MDFSQYRKTLKFKTIAIKYIPIDDIKCQYNPDLAKHWIKVCGDSFDIRSGPFWEYLNSKNTEKYMELFRLYGRGEAWIINNILKFQNMYEDIRKNGFNEKHGLPVVLDRPVVENEYNDSYEIWEGHRRLSICLYLGIKQKVKLCKII